MGDAEEEDGLECMSSESSADSSELVLLLQREGSESETGVSLAAEWSGETGAETVWCC